MPGFANRDQYTQLYNSIERETIKRLAEIEQSDADRCSNCGGKDCLCCEIYQDRQRWVSPDELFTRDELYENEYRPIKYDWEDEEE